MGLFWKEKTLSYNRRNTVVFQEQQFISRLNSFIFTGPPVVENGLDGPIKMDPGTLLSLEYASGRKRRITEGEGSDDEETGPTFAPPINDIYRSRQQKRAK